MKKFIVSKPLPSAPGFESVSSVTRHRDGTVIGVLPPGDAGQEVKEAIQIMCLPGSSRQVMDTQAGYRVLKVGNRLVGGR
jgi:hypothetical protein